MKSVLLAIPHYGSKNREFLYKCLHEYDKFKNYKIDIHLYCTEEIHFPKFNNIEIYESRYNPSIGNMLVHEHKIWFNELKDKYDYYIYCEDDVFITESVFKAFVTVQETLPIPYTCGLMRYELKNDSDYKFLFDHHPAHSVHRSGSDIIKTNYIIKKAQYFEPYNVHQGCYILTKNLLKYAIDCGRYLERDGYYAGYPLEGAASDVYFKCGIIKVIPRDNVKDLIVHHLPNKYVNMLPDVYTEQTTLNEIKIQSWQSNMTPIYV